MKKTMGKKALFIFLALSISVSLSLIATELFCRLFIRIPAAESKKDYPIYANDADLKWVLKRSFKMADITIDSDGFRSYAAKNGYDSGYAVLALGDSHTFGMGVSDEDTYPAQLEVILSDRLDYPVNVINGGVPAYNTAQAIIVYEKIAKKYHPDVVLLGIVADDIQDMYNYRADENGNLVTASAVEHFKNEKKSSTISHLLKRFKRALKTRSYLVRLLTDRFPGLLMKLGLQKSALDEYLAYWKDKKMLEREFQAIRDFNILVNKNNSRLILVVFPLADQLIYNRGFDDYQQKLSDFAKAQNIPLLDLTEAYMPAFAKKRNYSSLFIYSDGHPNDYGHKVIADYIADYLIRNGSIEMKMNK